MLDDTKSPELVGVLCIKTEYRETNSSGKLVPNAMTEAPIITGDIFNF